MKISHLKAHYKALCQVFLTRRIKDITESANATFEIWAEWREQVYEDRAEYVLDQIDQYFVDRHWQRLTAICYLRIPTLPRIPLKNKTCPVKDTCNDGEFTPGEFTCPYYINCFDAKLWEDYQEKYRNSPKGKTEELRRQQRQENLDLDDIPF